MASSQNSDGSDESSHDNESSHNYCQAYLTTVMLKRKFRLPRRIPGNDTLRVPSCVLNDTLCDMCLFFIASSLGLRNSAMAGCELCVIILESSPLAEYDRIVLIQSYRSQSGVHSCVNIDSITPGCRFGPLRHDRFAFKISPLGGFLRGQAEDKAIEFEFMLAKDESDCLALPYQNRQNHLRFPSISPSSQESFDQIRKWQDNCVKEHRNCPRQDIPLPTRLLYIFANTSSGIDGVKLVETKSLSNTSSDTRYVALSYCWGGWTGLITTQENIQSMMHNIPQKSLPAVVNDAIYVCRRYGIQYLWVDAFCICQDDDVEWEKEAANMANVYGGCQFVLSVLTSSKASDGFLKERNSRPVSLGHVEISYGAWSDSVKLFVRKIPWTLEEEFEHSPLNRRAWPLQEKVLGPAVLHYGRDQLIWECNTVHLCSETRETSIESPTVIRISDVIGTNNSTGIGDLWQALVEEFTRRQVTYKKDRLPALSGIASKLRNYGAFSGAFAGGMWETGIESQLVWNTEDITRTISFSPVQPNMRISTWSWAHRDVPISFNTGKCHCSTLKEGAKFYFEDNAEERKSNSAYLVENCSIILHGFIQKVSYEAISMHSQAVKYPDGNWFYLGLPGDDSRWYFDQQPVGPDQYYYLRLLERQKHDTKVVFYEVVPAIGYLVLRKSGRSKIASRYEPYTRVGTLRLYDVPDSYFNQPYPDLFCKNGKPLLTDGEWQDIALI